MGLFCRGLCVDLSCCRTASAPTVPFGPCPPNRVRSAVLPQRLAGIKGPSFLKGRQRPLCYHLLCPFYNCSSLKRQGAICPRTKERCHSSSHPHRPHEAEISIYKSSLPRLSPRTTHVCIFSGDISHNGKYPHLPCHSGKHQALSDGRDKAAAQKAHSSVLLCLSGRRFHFISASQLPLRPLALCFTIVTLYHR